jgi:hypothetical protein
MIAIRLTQANYHRILNDSPIDERDLRAMIEEYDTRHRDSAIYFVPKSDVAHDLDRNSWMTIPKVYLNENYDFDDSLIDIKFVEIKRK